MMLHLQQGAIIDQRQILAKLRNYNIPEMIKHFSVNLCSSSGEIIDIFPVEFDDRVVRIELFDDEIG